MEYEDEFGFINDKIEIMSFRFKWLRGLTLEVAFWALGKSGHDDAEQTDAFSLWIAGYEI